MGVEPAGGGALRARPARKRPRISRNGSAAIFVDDVPKIRAALEAAKESGNFYVEFRVRRADGRLHWLAGKGQIAARTVPAKLLRGIFYEIDERKQLEARSSPSTRPWRPASRSCARKRARSKCSTAPASRIGAELDLERLVQTRHGCRASS